MKRDASGSCCSMSTPMKYSAIDWLETSSARSVRQYQGLWTAL
jgi:hypothetical protein